MLRQALKGVGSVAGCYAHGVVGGERGHCTRDAPHILGMHLPCLQVTEALFFPPNWVCGYYCCVSACSDTSAPWDAYLSPVQLALCADNKNQNDDNNSADHCEKNPYIVVWLMDKTENRLLLCGRGGN